MILAAVPHLNIFLWLYLQIQVYQASIPDMHVLHIQITHSAKKVTSHVGASMGRDRISTSRVASYQRAEV